MEPAAVVKQKIKRKESKLTSIYSRCLITRNIVLPITAIGKNIKEVIEEIHKSETIKTEINITTIDDFVKEYNIKEIALLKIDTEGNELSVLQGAVNSLKESIINVIQIEFNEMNIISHTFLRDFIKILPNYKFYRLLPTELLEIKDYTPVYHEIFAFQNIIAFRQ